MESGLPFDNSPQHYAETMAVDQLMNGVEARDPRAEALAREVDELRRKVRSEGAGSMFGVVESMRNMTEALEELTEFLPEEFVWPTAWDVLPFSVCAEWGRSTMDSDADVDDTQIQDNITLADGTPLEGVQRAVWLHADERGVKMNATFRPGWPQCGASDFDARTAAHWLEELTRGWKWKVARYNGITSSSLARG